MSDIRKPESSAGVSRPLVIAGPCSAESREQLLSTAVAVAEAGVKIFRAGLWKPRTKPGGFEGVGAAGLEWLREVREQTGMKILTEVAIPTHIEQVMKINPDLLWIGARTTTDPFAVQAIADALKGTPIPILVKNPLSAEIDLWSGAVERLSNAGVASIGLIHRGFSTYEHKSYRNVPLWHIPMEMKRRFPSITLLCDPSHMGGSRTLIAPICQQAMDLMYDGLMIETHINPNEALSDKAQQITPAELKLILQNLIIRENSKEIEGIGAFRSEIDELDDELLKVLSRRMQISKEIGEYKKQHKIPVFQKERYGEIIQSALSKAKDMGLDEEFVRSIIEAIHRESVRLQLPPGGLNVI